MDLLNYQFSDEKTKLSQFSTKKINAISDGHESVKRFIKNWIYKAPCPLTCHRPIAD